ncbi:hypothetical protein AC1659_29185 [Rhodococcus erythropolis]|uniref:hypothetical protein n=1 Tax=Rhodococcus erythropolis TaxID=1833 RepID=UPI001BA94E7F|nr:hypothetical protein [Rhodococcus erythropolis]MBS2993378.1 hypothetical protein [Rhodococcus erythropolis]
MNQISTPRTGTNTHPAPNWITAEQASQTHSDVAELEARITEFWNTNPDIN